jgi:hypothetical protein
MTGANKLKDEPGSSQMHTFGKAHNFLKKEYTVNNLHVTNCLAGNPIWVNFCLKTLYL